MKVTINDREIALRYTLRAMMVYENIMNKSFTPNGITEVIVYFYATVLASDKDYNLEFDDFVDWLDQNPDAIQQFTIWLESYIKKAEYIKKK